MDLRHLKENIGVFSKCRLSTDLKIWLADEAFSNEVVHKNFTLSFFVRMQNKTFSFFEKIRLADETSSLFWILCIFIVYFKKEATFAIILKKCNSYAFMWRWVTAKKTLLIKIMTEMSACFCTHFENVYVYSK